MNILAQARPLRVFVAGLAHETNSFSPLPTSLRNFEEDICYRPPSLEGREAALGFAGYGDAIAIAREKGDEVVEGPCFWSQPSGPVSAPVYAELSGAIIDQLRQAGAFDMIILNLHGAMMAEGTDDPEGDLLARVREVVGPDVPVGAILDLHGNVSPQMVGSGAILVGVKEYPHTDYRARAGDVHAILSDMVRLGSRFSTVLRTIPTHSWQGTTEEPMCGLVRFLVEAEGRDGVRSVTLMHGFPWSDWEQAGASVLIVSEDADPAVVEQLADDIAGRFMSIVGGAPVARLGVAEVLDEALASSKGAGPVVISDGSDNPGGGAAGDSSFLLRELIDRGCDNVALGMIWDPQAARVAADAGVGARLRLRIGGKVGPLSGDPIDVDVEVLSVSASVRQRFFSETPNCALGLAVGLRIGGIDIVVNSIRQQVFSPECFTELGIDVAAKSIVVVKSSQHFRAGFDVLACRTLYCDAPGSLSVDLAQMPYARLRLMESNGGFGIDKPVEWAHWP